MSGPGLAWRLAGRELRAGPRGFAVFIACLTLGVAAIAGVGTLGAAVVAGLRADAAALLGGDVDIRLHSRPAEPAQHAYMERAAAAVSATADMRAMARRADGAGGRALVELKAVDGAYPLIGALAITPPLADPFARAPDGAWGAVADANLLGRLGIAAGDRIRVGDAVLVVRAVIDHEPDRIASVFSLGPRLMVAAPALAATGLVQPGAHIHYHYRVRLAAGADPGAWIATLRDAFPEAGWRVRGVDEAAPGVRRFIDRLTLFLTFVGLTALLVGGIGVGNAVAGYLEGKAATNATLKCLGAPGGLVFRVYLLQVLALALGAVVLGLLVGAAAPIAGLAALAPYLPVAPRIGVYPGPLLLAAVFGVATAVTFSLWPLGRARRIPAATLFRDRVAPAAVRPGRATVLAVVAGVAVLAGLTLLSASDRGFAAWFVGGALATLLALRGGAALLTAVARRLPRPANAAARLVITNLHRPGAATPKVVMSLGLGLSVLVAVALIEGNLSRQINERLPEEAPAFFFIDIQPGQVAAFDAAIHGVPGTRGLKQVPSLRGRIVAIAGVPVEKARIAPDSAWAVEGDRALTYAAEPSPDSEIVAGAWWPPDYRGPPLISLDAGLARGFGIGVGDTLTVNILGRDVTAKVASLREIDWRSLRFDFAIIVSPGVLEGAPQTYIAAVQAPPAAEDAVEAAVTGRFANITAIRVRDALEAAARLLAGIGAAVRGAAAITLVSGALVLAGAIAAGRRRRVYEAVVFKVLGATRGRLLGAFVLEYGVLGLATGVLATAIGTLTAWAVVVHLMRSPWGFLPGVAAATVGVCVVLTVVLGFAGTWRALGHKAAPHLRNE